MSNNLLTAAQNLISRPADEHFSSMANLHAAADRDAQNHREAVVPISNLEVAVDDGDLVCVSKRANAGYKMTHHSLRALCRVAGAPADFIVGRLSPKAASIALSDALSRSSGDVKVHIGTITGDSMQSLPPVLRGITSPTYARVSDASILAETDRWLVGAGFQPARPTKNTDAQQNNIMGNNKPCLFRGDRDSLAFFMHEEGAVGAGGRPIRRGVLVENSEVGASSIWCRSFVFDDLCANFIIWGAKELQEFRGIHRGDPQKLLRDFREQLRMATPAVQARELEVLQKAAKTIFADDEESAVERLIKQFELSEASAKMATMLAFASENRGVGGLTHAGIANGVTSLAKSTNIASKLVEVASIGGAIYEAAMA